MKRSEPDTRQSSVGRLHAAPERGSGASRGRGRWTAPHGGAAAQRNDSSLRQLSCARTLPPTGPRAPFGRYARPEDEPANSSEHPDGILKRRLLAGRPRMSGSGGASGSTPLAGPRPTRSAKQVVDQRALTCATDRRADSSRPVVAVCLPRGRVWSARVRRRRKVRRKGPFRIRSDRPGRGSTIGRRSERRDTATRAILR